ncbi:MAG: universal stress protein [Planctomycetes bacterium]|jgi:nucleotide-binding universal stress UspA family protein|nr:universal stress protein [Planctomycetota bacterium]
MGHRIKLKKILVPTDFSEHAGQAFLHAAAIARWTGAELLVLHVVEKFMDHSLVYSDVWPFQKPVPQYYRDLEERTADRLQREVLSSVGADVTFRVVVSTGTPAPEIVAVAQREEVDLIVIATHGRGGIAQALLGSTTERVLRRAPCPVLVIRSGAPGFVEPVDG